MATFDVDMERAIAAVGGEQEAIRLLLRSIAERERHAAAMRKRKNESASKAAALFAASRHFPGRSWNVIAAALAEAMHAAKKAACVEQSARGRAVAAAIAACPDRHVPSVPQLARILSETNHARDGLSA